MLSDEYIPNRVSLRNPRDVPFKSHLVELIAIAVEVEQDGWLTVVGVRADDIHKKVRARVSQKYDLIRVGCCCAARMSNASGTAAK
jgi:hypothetical protein